MAQQEERVLHLRDSCAFSIQRRGWESREASKHSLKDLLLLEGSSSSWCLDYKVTLSASSNKWSPQVSRVNRTPTDHSVTIFHLHRISVLVRGCLLMPSRKKKNHRLCSQSFFFFLTPNNAVSFSSLQMAQQMAVQHKKNERIMPPPLMVTRKHELAAFGKPLSGEEVPPPNETRSLPERPSICDGLPLQSLQPGGL